MDATRFADVVAASELFPGAEHGTAASVVYASLGLAGETSEVVEKEIAGDPEGVVAELGDVGWYLTRLHLELDLDVTTIASAADTSPEAHNGLDSGRGTQPLLVSAGLVVAAGRMAELAKKTLRDDNAVLTPTRRDLMRAELAAVAHAWRTVGQHYGVTAEQAFAHNAAKVASRRARGVLAGSGDNR